MVERCLTRLDLPPNSLTDPVQPSDYMSPPICPYSQGVGDPKERGGGLKRGRVSLCIEQRAPQHPHQSMLSPAILLCSLSLGRKLKNVFSGEKTSTY